MKNRFKITAVSLTLGFILGINVIAFTQPPPPPPEHGSGGNNAPAGGMAPVGSGLVLMLGLGAAYGGKKLYSAWKRIDE